MNAYEKSILTFSAGRPGDDRDVRPGEKFADAELMGMPCRVVISDKTLDKGVAEVVERASGETREISIDKLGDLL